ncbi:MAG: Sec-independent protein translocase protein TatB [Acidobacteriota bacterium]
MFLFIFENIGTSELILVGIVALIFLGPRKLPEMARKMGKMMADFRNTTNEFKSTWEREVNFEEEEHAIRTGELATSPAVARENSILGASPANVASPEIRSIDREAFEKLAPVAIDESRENPLNDAETTVDDPSTKPDSLSDKRTWL